MIRLAAITAKRALLTSLLLFWLLLGGSFLTHAPISPGNAAFRPLPHANAAVSPRRWTHKIPSAGRRHHYCSPSTLQMAAGKTSVLFVCLGNICRSPTAEAVFKNVTSKAGEVEKFVIDSCGTGGGSRDWYKEGGESYHEGDPPDARMTAAAAKRGIELAGSSRPLRPKDLDDFDLIIGMDAMNAEYIATAAKHWDKSELAATKTRTMTSYCRSSGGVKSVPDPYYGGPEGFEKVLDLLNDACEGLLENCRAGEA